MTKPTAIMGTSRFLTLPAELRDMVYEHVIADISEPPSYNTKTNRLTHPSKLAHVDRQISKEFEAMLLLHSPLIAITIVNFDLTPLADWINEFPEAIARTFASSPDTSNKYNSGSEIEPNIPIFSRELLIKLSIDIDKFKRVDADEKLTIWLGRFRGVNSRTSKMNIRYEMADIPRYARTTLQYYHPTMHPYTRDSRAKAELQKIKKPIWRWEYGMRAERRSDAAHTAATSAMNMRGHHAKPNLQREEQKKAKQREIWYNSNFVDPARGRGL